MLRAAMENAKKHVKADLSEVNPNSQWKQWKPEVHGQVLCRHWEITDAGPDYHIQKKFQSP